MKTISSFSSKLLALTFALMASVSTFAYDFQSGYLFYNILPDGTVAVTSETYGMPYDYLPTSLVIPSEVTGYNGETYIVTEIANYAFSGCSMLDTLVIPNTVKKIGMYAFTGCTKLVYISFPESIEDILGGALYECAWYNNQPDGLIYIGNLLYRYKGTAPTGTIVVKDGTKAILDFTFSNQPNIQSVVLPESVTSIHIQAFGDCPNLESVVLPSKLEAIEDHTFQYCEKLTNIKLPDALKLIGKNAFIGCANLTKLTLPSSVQIIEDEAFANCTSLTEVTCYATIPPVRGDVVSDSPSDWFFDGVEVSKIPLYVPAESIDLYKEAEQWMFFNPILPIEPSTSYKSQWCDTWNVMWFDGMRFDETASTSQYRLGKDTIIGDYTYSKFTSRTSVRFTNDRKVYVYYEGFDDNDPYTPDLPTGEYLAYDFSAQVGDTLEVFSGIGTYSTYPCVVYDVETAPSPCVVDDVQADLKTFPLIIKLRPLCDVDGEGNMEISSEEITWIEGVGSPEGFLISSLPCGWGGGGTFALLCAYKGDELKYTGSLYDEYGCEYNANDPQLPLVEWCNQWNILAHGYLGPQEPLYGAKTTIYQLGADTIINHLRYKQLTRYASDDVNQTKTYVGAIRFTKNNRQVYFYYNNAEYLLYDFKAQVGDTLEVFAGIDNYRDHKTYKHVVTNKEPIQDEQCKVTLDVFVSQEHDGEIIHEEKFTSIWIEGVGSPDGIVHNCATLREGNVVTDVLCAYVDDRRMYRTPYPDYRILGCEYNDGDFIEGAFPILSGLQRTICNEYCEDSKTSLQKFEDILFEHDKPYIYCESAFLIREENNKILIYSHSLDKDLVLYDFTLKVGDSLPRLYLDESAEKDLYWIDYNIMNVVDYHKDLEGNILPADTLIVTDVSAITLLDGKEYKKWTFNNGMEYVEGIGSFGNNMRFFDFFQLIGNMAVPVSLHGTHLVCVSKNNKLLYQMDDAEMERLGTECLCDYDSGHRKDNAKDGQIGGRPTPTQWNQLEVVLREMDNNHTILQAETFSYTLEDISQQVNNKTYFQLARQSTKDTATTKSVVGALHFGKDEDNRVYFLRDEVEYVLYDFTAEPGDTVEIFAGINNYPQETTYTHVVTGKDTLENGACRMLLEVVFPDDTNTTAENAEKVWLAGLGSVDGIVHNAAKRASNAHAAPSRTAHSSDTKTSVMLCAWREDSCLYTTDHPDYDSFGCVYNQDPTSIEDTHSPSPIADYQKLLRNGQLLIIYNGKTYNVLGIAVE